MGAPYIYIYIYIYIYDISRLRVKYVKGTLGFTEFGSILRGLSPYQAFLSHMKMVLIVDPHLHVSKWMHRRLPSQSRLYFLITGWWWLVARGRGLDGRPKECRSHLSHYEIPTWTAPYIVCSDGSQGCVQDWSNDFMHFLVTNYKCTLTNEGLPTQPYLLCVLPIWFIHTQQYLATIGYHKTPHYAIPFISFRFWSKCSSSHISTWHISIFGGTLLVAQLVEALRYKPEGRGFDSRRCHWIFSLT